MLALLLIASVLAGAGPPEKHGSVPWLAPSAFPSVPRSVRATLGARRCRIPQPWPYSSPANIIAGHFRSHWRVDYAALCSRDGESTVLVLNGQTGAVIAELNKRPDADYVQTVVDGSNGYSRQIEPVPPSPDGFCFESSPPCPCKPAIYDGIADIFEGKGSETHCWHKGWQTVISGD